MLKLGKISCLPWLFLSALIEEGDRVVDATAGNGWDTLALARMVGAQGRVDVFDIPEQALAQTKERLEANRAEAQVRFWLRDHACLADVVAPGIRAAVFNLGYLPGSDHSVTTQPLSTRKAVQGAMGLLCPGGAVVVTVYRGLPSGVAEGRCLTAYLQTVSLQSFCVVEGKHLNHEESAPYWVIIQAKGYEGL